jgi:hypothetical protein
MQSGCVSHRQHTAILAVEALGAPKVRNAFRIGQRATCSRHRGRCASGDATSSLICRQHQAGGHRPPLRMGVTISGGYGGFTHAALPLVKLLSPFFLATPEIAGHRKSRQIDDAELSKMSAERGKSTDDTPATSRVIQSLGPSDGRPDQLLVCFLD